MPVQKMIPLLFLLVMVACNTKRSDISADLPKPPAGKYAVLDSIDKRIKIEQIPTINVVSLQFSGNYKRHPEAYARLSDYVSKNYATAGGIIGIYPKDPDLFEDDQLTWEISMRVFPGQRGIKNYPPENPGDSFDMQIPNDMLAAPLHQFKKPEKPFIIKTLEPTEALTLISDIAHLGPDGLALNAWLSLNNYVQTNPTRTEFGTAREKPMQTSVKIIVPIKKRTRETR